MVFLALLALAAPARALSIHVTPDGAGDGSEADPGNLESALAAAAPGDTVWLHEGSYGDVILRGEDHGPTNLTRRLVSGRAFRGDAPAR